MATQALYRRWRSQTFGEIIGQEHVTQTLLNALRAGRIGHAYLLAGPRGTGKTTTARVLAKAVNCLDPQNGEPCNRCAICRSINEGRALDLIEIDGASNRGIDEIRALREKIAFSPGECRYKVYVIDEVHMLTDPAFNALLKTLEEPPPHAILVLATTEPHRIPLTVLSRCQRFDFRRVPLPSLRQKLERICVGEQVRAAPEALDAIARYAAGSFRDAESLLDQLVSYGSEEITLDQVHRVLGTAPQEVISGIVAAIAARDVSAGLHWIDQGLNAGVEPRQLAREVLEHLRGLLLLKNGSAALLAVTPELLGVMNAQAEAFSLRRLLETLRKFNEAANQLKSVLRGQLPLELALVESTALPETEPLPDKGPVGVRPIMPSAPPAAPPPSAFDAESGARRTLGAASAVPPREPAVEVAEPLASPGPQTEPPVQSAGATEITLEWLQANWGPFLQAVRPRSRSVEALLKSCEPVSVEKDVVTLGFYHSFHKDRMDESKNRVVAEDALREITQRAYRVKTALCEGDRQAKERDTEASRRERLLGNPVVNEAIARYGAKVIDVQ